ncbi:hypothetical protein [Thalassolituus sp.]|jgi:hypothetical protein|uniref:hypothetical protein n=1 Tax=Thalassolituus sp. TaxID=2030822 RepID=UPI002A83841A|nr:hypothetical protein [Thalassolituus sp.]
MNRKQWVEGRELKSEKISVQYLVKPVEIIEVSFREVEGETEGADEYIAVLFRTKHKEYLYTYVSSLEEAQNQSKTLCTDIERYIRN